MCHPYFEKIQAIECAYASEQFNSITIENAKKNRIEALNEIRKHFIHCIKIEKMMQNGLCQYGMYDKDLELIGYDYDKYDDVINFNILIL